MIFRAYYISIYQIICRSAVSGDTHMSICVFATEVLCVISPKQMSVSGMTLIYSTCLIFFKIV